MILQQLSVINQDYYISRNYLYMTAEKVYKV